MGDNILVMYSKVRLIFSTQHTYSGSFVIIYKNGLFQHRSFVVRSQPNDTIARVRAHLLHILYEIGKGDHQFRLRFKGEYLRDAYTINDYNIMENAIIKMVPLSKGNDVSEIHFLHFNKMYVHNL